tara:strand:+ start:2744 stop:2953 length:210 start_codon:yes stop_codon:yes gene_type:complete
MKLNELISDFSVFTTIEEQSLLATMPDLELPYNSYNERQQFILDNLIRKSLVSKIGNEKDSFLVKKNAV